MSRRTWSSLFRSIFGGVSSHHTKQAQRPQLALEKMEDRTTPATFAFNAGNGTLTIDLNNTNEALTLTSQGGGNYVFTSTNNFTGTNQTGLTGNGTTTLNITNALATLDFISINDTASGTSVAFGTSTGDYTDIMDIVLDNAGAGGVTVNAATNFSVQNFSVSSASSVDVNASLAANIVYLSATNFVNVASNITGGIFGVMIFANTAGTATGDTDGISIFNNSQVTTTNNGNIVLQGKGGAGNGGFNNGIVVATGSSISANGSGTVTITGTGGSGTGSANFGINLSGSVASGSGDISLSGTYGNLGTSQTNSNGLVIFNSAPVSTSGNVGISATGATTTDSEAIYLDASVTAGTGKSITVTADSVWFNSSAAISANSGTVSFLTRSAGTGVNLGGNDVLSGSLVLGLTNAELNSVTTGTIVVGNANTGAATVSSAVSITPNLQLTSAGITQTASLSVTGTTALSVNTASSNILLASAANNLAGTVSIGGTASNVQDFALRNTNPAAGAITNLGNATTTNLRNLTISYDNAAYVVPSFTTVASLNNISITAGGAITQAAGGIVQSAGATSASFNAGANAITLTQSNDFTGSVTATGAATQITDTNALTVVLTTTGSTVLSAGGNLVASGSVTGATSDLSTTTTAGGTTAFGATTVGQNLSVTSAGAVSQTGALAVTGTTTITATGQAITLTTATNDFSGAVTATGAATQITDTNALTVVLTTTGSTVLSAGGNLVASGSVSGATSALSTTTTGTGTTSLGATTVGQNLTVTSAGAVSQTGALAVTGTSTISATGQAITLTTATNDFAGAVTATGAATQITDTNALTVVLTTTGSTVLSAGGNLVASGSVSGATSALSTTTTGTGTTSLGATTVGQNLSVTSAGAVSQTGALTVTGTSNITATGQAITLTTATNDFAGSVTATGAATQITDTNALTVALTTTGSAVLSAGGNLVASGSVSGATSDLSTTTTGAGTTNFGATTVGQNLSVTSVGAVGQTGALTVTGSTGINASSNLIALTQANDFQGVVSLSNSGANNVSITDANALTLGTLSVGGDLAVISTGALNLGQGSVGGALSATSNGGAITQTGALTVTGTTGIAAGSGNAITLDNQSNNFSTVTVTSGGSVTLAETGGFTVGGIAGIGAGNITINASGVVAATGAITTTGSILLQGQINTATIGVAGGAGTVQFVSSFFTNLTNGASSVTIGAASQSGAVTVNTVSFSDPVTIRATGGSVTINGAITGTGNASVTLSASPTTIFLNNDITTAGQPILLDNGSGGATSVVLGSNVTLSSGAGNIDINATVNGAFGLTLNSTGITTLRGAVGGLTPLASVTTDAGGTLAINGGAVTTTGSQLFNDAAVSVGTDLTLTTNINGSITFAGAVNASTSLVTFDADGTGSITASNTGNDFATVVINGANNATLADANAFDFGTTMVGKDLSLVAVGKVTQSGPITVNGLAAFQTDSTANITLNDALNQLTTAAFAGNTVQVTNSRNISLAGIGSGKDYAGNTVTPPNPEEVATLVTGDLTLKLGASVLRSANTVVSAATGVSFVPFRVQGILTIYSTGQTSVLVTKGSRAGNVVFEGRPLDANGNVQLAADPTGVLLYDLDNFLPLVPDNRTGNSQGKIIVTGQSLNFDNGSVVFTPSSISTANDTLSIGAPTLVPGMRVSLATSQAPKFINKNIKPAARTNNQKFVLANPGAFSSTNLTVGTVNPAKTAVVLNSNSAPFDFKGAANYVNPPASPLVTLAFQQTLLRVKAVDSGSGDTLFSLDNAVSKTLVNSGTIFKITNEGNPSVDALPIQLQGLTGQSFTIEIPNSAENSGDTFETFFLIDSSQAKVAVTDDFNIQNVLLYSTGPGANNRSVATGATGKALGGQSGPSGSGRSAQQRAPGSIQRFDIENKTVSSTFVVSGQNVNSLDLTVGNAIAFINGPTAGVGSDQYSQTVVHGDVKLGGSLSLVINNASFDPELTRCFTIIDNQGGNPVSGTFEGLPERGIIFAGNQAFTITYQGGDGNDVVLVASNDVPDATGAVVGRPFQTALAAGDTLSTIGNAVQFTSPAGASRQLLPFLNTGYTGNLSASAIDRTGDGIADSIVAGVASPNQNTTLRVIDAATARVAYTLTPFGPNFRGGMRVSAGIANVDGEVLSVIVVGAGPGSTSRVKVYDSVSGQLVKSFNAFSPKYRGGVTVAISSADVNDPSVPGRLVVSSLVNPVVRVFNLETGGIGGAQLESSFSPFGSRNIGMVNPAIQIGNLDNDRTTVEIVVGSGFGSNLVSVFDTSGNRLGSINPFPPAYRGGVRVGLADVDRDGILDIVLSSAFRPSPGTSGIATAVYMLQQNGINDYVFSTIRGAGDNFFNLFLNGQSTADFSLGVNPALNRRPGAAG